MRLPGLTDGAGPGTRKQDAGNRRTAMLAWLRAVLLLACVVCSAAGCATEGAYTLPEFASFTDFADTLESVAGGERGQVDAFWDALVAGQRVPFVLGGEVAFLYRGRGRAVRWVGDFTGWQKRPPLEGRRVGRSDIWAAYTTFPTNARVEYRIVVDGKDGIADPANPLQQWGGFGPNSVVAMPDYVFPPHVVPREGVAPGALSAPLSVRSANLGYVVNYQVYTPARYETLHDLPAIYVTDAHEYTDPRMGAMPIVLDNLIAAGNIGPILAVFIDPRDPETKQNRRQSEYLSNPRYAAFITQELVPAVDSAYRTDPRPERRAILGESYGGVNAAYCGLAHPDVFGLVAMQSPAFVDEGLYEGYRAAERLPLRVFLSTGYVEGSAQPWDFDARTIRGILEDKGYPLRYMEVPEGHSWGQWRGQIDDLLVYFYGPPG